MHEVPTLCAPTPTGEIDYFDRWYSFQGFSVRQLETDSHVEHFCLGLCQGCQSSSHKWGPRMATLTEPGCRGHWQTSSNRRQRFVLSESAYLPYVFQKQPATALKRTMSPVQAEHGAQFSSTEIHWGPSIKMTFHIAGTIGRFSTLSPCKPYGHWTMDNSCLREPHLVSDSRS